MKTKALQQHIDKALQDYLDVRAREIADEIEKDSGKKYKVVVDKVSRGVVSLSPSDDLLARTIEFQQGNTAWRKQRMRLKNG